MKLHYTTLFNFWVVLLAAPSSPAAEPFSLRSDFMEPFYVRSQPSNVGIYGIRLDYHLLVDGGLGAFRVYPLAETPISER